MQGSQCLHGVQVALGFRFNAGPDTQDGPAHVSCCWCLSETDLIFTTGPYWLGNHHVRPLQQIRDVLFPCWRSFAQDASSRAIPRWKAIPKLHMCEHTYDEAIATRRNPGAFYNMAYESMMGNSKKAAGRQFQPRLGKRILFNLMAQWAIDLERE